MDLNTRFPIKIPVPSFFWKSQPQASKAHWAPAGFRRMKAPTFTQGRRCYFPPPNLLLTLIFLLGPRNICMREPSPRCSLAMESPLSPHPRPGQTSLMEHRSCSCLVFSILVGISLPLFLFPRPITWSKILPFLSPTSPPPLRPSVFFPEEWAHQSGIMAGLLKLSTAAI